MRPDRAAVNAAVDLAAEAAKNHAALLRDWHRLPECQRPELQADLDSASHAARCCARTAVLTLETYLESLRRG